MPQCLIPNCENEANHNLGARLRRPDTTAIWAEAFLCDIHASQRYTVDITLTPTATRSITNISAGGMWKRERL